MIMALAIVLCALLSGVCLKMFVKSGNHLYGIAGALLALAGLALL